MNQEERRRLTKEAQGPLTRIQTKGLENELERAREDADNAENDWYRAQRWNARKEIQYERFKEKANELRSAIEDERQRHDYATKSRHDYEKRISDDNAKKRGY